MKRLQLSLVLILTLLKILVECKRVSGGRTSYFSRSSSPSPYSPPNDHLSTEPYLRRSRNRNPNYYLPHSRHYLPSYHPHSRHTYKSKKFHSHHTQPRHSFHADYHPPSAYNPYHSHPLQPHATNYYPVVRPQFAPAPITWTTNVHQYAYSSPVYHRNNSTYRDGRQEPSPIIYIVHHYNPSAENATPTSEIDGHKIVQCISKTSNTLCPPNTNALCLNNGTVFCTIPLNFTNIYTNVSSNKTQDSTGKQPILIWEFIR